MRLWHGSRWANATFPLWVSVFVVGCASEAAPAAESPPPAETTSGGETATETPPTLPPERATAPIPVPQPGLAREQLSPALQLVWERVELAVAVRPPEPPTGATEADIEAWASGPFAEWLEARGAATNLALAAMRGMAEAPIAERALGTALFGYLYEDAASSIRGAPIPEALAADPELLSIYTESLDEHLMPFARLSAQAYYGCVALFQQVADPAWQEWPAYCNERGGEVVDTFGVVPPEPPADDARPDISEGSSGEI
jgi:hypothetical protein